MTLVLALACSFASFALAPITGTFGACVGATSYLNDVDSTLTSTWSSSNIAVATVDAMGLVTGVSAGTAIITFTSGGSYVTATFSVGSVTPAAITGTTSLCVGTSSTLSDATPGGIWSSSGGSVSIGSATGIVTPAGGGATTITYSISGCSVSTVVTVGSTTVDSVTGPSIVCLGSAITLSDLTPGGTWSSMNPSTATVSATGVVTGIATGSTNIEYSVTGCGGTVTNWMSVNVMSVTTAGTISGSSSITVGAVTTLSDAVAGGAWSSSNPLIATAGASTGIVTGVSVGSAVISYTVSGCGSAYTATLPITVTALDGISGYVLLSASSADIKVWLITYNPSTLLLEASDSTTISGSGSVYYQFTGAVTDSYRIKAAITSTGSYDSNYVPTYHTSSFYWHDATVLYHTTGTGDINQDINMALGTPSSGPGFIGGNVITGANKGTSGGAGAAGLLIYVINSAGNLVASTYTDASGNYSFTGLSLGTYTIYPEAINYNTTAYTSINLTSTATSMSAASFIQHTISKTITPIVEGVNNVQSYVSSVVAFPNPTSGKLNIQWQESATETGIVAITDITGREISKTTINMNEGTGVSQFDLSGLTNGIYMISVKSGTINYNGKIQVQR